MSGTPPAGPRQPYAHDALLVFGPDEDDGAPGAAITTALCGHWEHEPPCPLAAHYTGVTRAGDRLRLHVLFAASPGDEGEVRRRIDEALRERWPVVGSGTGVIAADEAAHAARLTT
jgi:hypothetical protein